MATAQKQSWALVALDGAVDTTTPPGEAMANVLATFAQFERRLISQRTRDALAAKRASGVQLGRRREISRAVAERIVREREAGTTWTAIADQLNGPAQRGWHPYGARWKSLVALDGARCRDEPVLKPIFRGLNRLGQGALLREQVQDLGHPCEVVLKHQQAGKGSKIIGLPLSRISSAQNSRNSSKVFMPRHPGGCGAAPDE